MAFPKTKVHLIQFLDRIPCDENGEVANTFPAAPDWTIEILSPDQSQTKVTKNILHCLRHGTEVGWLVDPGEQTVFVYRSKQEPEVLDEPDEVVAVPAFASELQLTLMSCLVGYWSKDLCRCG